MIKIDCAYDKMVDVNNLIPHKDNPNKHPKRQIELLAKIIKYQGFRHAITVSTRSGFIVGGHGRLAAAELLGLKKVPVDYQDFEDEAQEYAHLIADNKISELAEHDDKIMLDKILSDFPDIDLELLGLDDFILPSTEEQQDAEDNVPEIDESNIRTKLGDIYILGEHRLMCGDSTDKKTVEKLMNGELADLWIADPPFGVSYVSKNAAVHGGIVKNAIGKEIKSDEKTVEELKPFWLLASKCAYEFTTNEASNYWCACQGSDKMMMMMMMMMDEAGWNIRHELIWVKSSFVFGRSDYHYRHEPIIYGWKKKGKHNWNGNRKQSSVFEIDRPHKSDMHPTTKPVELFSQFISNSSKSGDKIFESFGGSGTTLIASEKLSRKSFTMELDPYYCDVIVSRWCKYTNQTKIKLNGKSAEWVLNG